MKVNAFTTADRLMRKDAIELSIGDDPEAQRKLVQYGLSALGIGAGARGLLGLAEMVGRKLSPPKPRYPSAIVGDMPYPAVAPEKTADGQSWYDRSVWGRPAGLAAAALGGVAGWKGVGALLDWRKKKERNEELDSAKQEFEKAIMGSYSAPRTAPPDLGTKLGMALDQLFDAAVKQAEAYPIIDNHDGAPRVKQAWLDWLLGEGTDHSIAGNYLALATGLAGLGAVGTYKYVDSNSRRKALERAMKQRQLRNYMSRPSETLLIPRPVLQTPQATAGSNELTDESAEQAASDTSLPRHPVPDLSL